MLVVLSMLVGCARTTIEITGAPLTAPLCQIGAEPLATAIFWSPLWRPDQKEPSLREAAALRGIENFVAQTPCLAVAGVQRLPVGNLLPADGDLQSLAAVLPVVPERAVLIVVRELGPRLILGIPGIVEGGTEVLIDVQVQNPQNSLSLANTRTLWRNGGSFAIKGVKSLDQDMRAALSATLMPSGETR